MSLFIIVIFSTSYFFSSSYFFSNENALEENIEGTIKSSSLDSEDPEGWPKYANSYISDLTVRFQIDYYKWHPWVPPFYSWEGQYMTVSFRNYNGNPYPSSYPEYHTFSVHGASSFARQTTYDLVYCGYTNQIPNRYVNFKLKSDYIYWIILPIGGSVTYEHEMRATRAEGPWPFSYAIHALPRIDGDNKGAVTAYYYSYAYAPSIEFSTPSAFNNEEYEVSFELLENDAQDIRKIFLQRNVESQSGWTTVKEWGPQAIGFISKELTHTDTVDVGSRSRRVRYRVLIEGTHYKWRSPSWDKYITITPPDDTPPVITIISPSEGLITNQWMVRIAYTVSDDITAPSRISIGGPASGSGVTTEGFWEFTITATDEAGNTASRTVSFTIDRTSPHINILGPPSEGLNTNQDVILIYTVYDSVTATDDIVITGPYSGTRYSLGQHYEVTVTATDEAGNSDSKTVSFIIDKTNPIINFLGPPVGYYNTEQTVEWEVSDEYLDEVTSSHPNPTTFSTEGTHRVEVTASDIAGNTVIRSHTIIIDKTAPVITITGPPEGYYNTDQTVSYSVYDLYLDEVFCVYPNPVTFTEDGIYQVTVSADDFAGNYAEASSAEFVIDKTLPETLINFGDTHFIINDNVHLTSATPIELLPSDLSGISGTFYKVSNDAFDSGWILYTGIFSLNSLDLQDGDYVLHYFSTDIAGNSETAKTKSIVLDNSPPELSWEHEGFAFQDGILFNIEALDATEVTEVVLSIRELNGPIVAEIPVEYIGGNYWQSIDKFNSITVPDGYYELIVDASDKFDFMTMEIFSFSIRNWAVLELLPSTESNKVGRTMPVKFALRVVAAVDPNMPFVVNQELDIFIADTATDEILQHSTYEDTSRDYRISELTEHYITNFKTHKTPTTYLVSIYRRDFFIGVFSFATVK